MEDSHNTFNFAKIRLALTGWELSWKGLISNKNGEWWLIGQILLILAHFIPLSLNKSLLSEQFYSISNVLGIAIFFLGGYKIIKALLDLGVNLSPLPTPKSGAQLITNGIYNDCRHPLYQGLLFCSFGITVGLGSVFHLLLFDNMEIHVFCNIDKQFLHLHQ